MTELGLSLVVNRIGEGGNVQTPVGHRKEMITGGGDPFGLISWDSW